MTSHNPVDPDINRPSGRRCFVTVGATAGFRQLLEEILEPEFLKALSVLGFEFMDVQCGPDHGWFEERVQKMEDRSKYGIKIVAFGLTDNMMHYMLQCRGERGVRLPGCIIAHAGTGTIMEAVRYSAPLVVVPNPTLMDNHQAELAEECERQKWCVYGKLGKLADAVALSQERIHEGRLHDLPPYSPPPFPVSESERITLFDWMVLTCYPEELARQQHLLDLQEVEAKAQLQDEENQEKEIQSGLQVD